MKENDSNSQKVIRGISSQTMVTVVLGVVEIVSFSIMSRLLTKEDFGYYAAINAITVVFSTFAETGIGSAIVQQKTLHSRYVNNAFTISLFLGGFLSLLLFLLASPLASIVADKSMKLPLMLMSGTLLLNSLTSVNNSLMHRKLQFLRIGMIKLVSLIITTIVAIWLAILGLGYYAIISKAVLGAIITYLLTLYYCKTHFKLAFDKDTGKRIFSFSGWLVASSLFRNLAHQIDKLMMPSLLSVQALGAYNRPKDFIEQVSSRLNGIFDTALFPVLSGLQDNLAVLNSAYKRSLFVMNLFASLLTLAFMFNSRLLIRVFFGEEWLGLQPVMFVISISLLFNIDGRLSDCYLRSLAMTKQQFYFRIFETVVKVIGVLVSYKWGIFGVAVSLALTNFISNILKILYVGIVLQEAPLRVVKIITMSWKYMLFFLPLCVVAFMLLPNSMGGEFAMAAFFLILTIVVFLFFPKIVGQQYKDEIHGKVLLFLKQKTYLKMINR